MIGVAWVCCVAFARPAWAQDATAGPGGGTIGGLVVDADGGQGLRGARVYLEVLGTRSDTSGRRNGTAGFEFFQDAETDSTGAYLFEGIPPGRYRVHVERPGYGPATAEVELRDGGARIGFGLQLDPILLPNVVVHADGTQPFARTASPVAERRGARLAAVRTRQARYLEADTRTLTAGDVTEAVTAGEPDLFRALQRMPGVGRRDDYTAILWTRGAPWVHTRVYFDDMPLYNPTHAGSLFSSISPNGVGEVTYHPGVRSARWGEGAAGILDLRSRAGRRGAPISGSADLSLASAQAALEGDLAGGHITWMVAGRRTHIDVLAGAWEMLNPHTGLRVPYDFSDVTARVDVRLGPATLQASSLHEQDRLRGDIPGLLVGNTGRWGNRVRQVTLTVPVGAAQASVYTGTTRYATIVDESWRAPGTRPPSLDEVSLPALESGIDHDRSGIRIASRAPVGGLLYVAAGLEAVTDRIRYDGPFSLLGEGIPGLLRDSITGVPYRIVDRHDYRATWAETRIHILDGLVLQSGIRIEDGDSVRSLGNRLVAPRFSARWGATPSLSFSAGWGRSFQYTQALGATAGPLGPQLHLGHLWVLAGEGYPAIRSDIATAGAEYWANGAWLVGLNVYHRDANGVVEPDPTPGVIHPLRSHVETGNLARGAELSARRLVGRWTGSFGYAFARAETLVDLFVDTPEGGSVDPVRYPGSADIRHSVDVTSSYRLDDAWRVGGAFSFASGVPFTRVVIDEEGLVPPRLEAPGGNRTPAYASVDLLLDYSGELSGWRVGAYLQLLNALGRRNRVTYAGSVQSCPGGRGGTGACIGEPVIRDRFRSGLPRLPLVGFRVLF